MYHLPLTLETPGENLALGEALLEAAEAGELRGEVLRTWEPANSFVVLGRSSPASEAQLETCRRDGVPVLRRASGGASVIAGPGCLMYAVVLDAHSRPQLQGIDRTHQYVLGKHAAALAALANGVARAGLSDLTLPATDGGPPRKFSGNSLRVRRRYVLYHGAILYNFPLDRIARWLAAPVRQPNYRQQRSHEDFLMNFPATRDVLTAALVNTWQAHEKLGDWPQQRTSRLAASRYATTEWNALPAVSAT